MHKFSFKSNRSIYSFVRLNVRALLSRSLQARRQIATCRDQSLDWSFFMFWNEWAISKMGINLHSGALWANSVGRIAHDASMCKWWRPNFIRRFCAQIGSVNLLSEALFANKGDQIAHGSFVREIEEGHC